MEKLYLDLDRISNFKFFEFNRERDKERFTKELDLGHCSRNILDLDHCIHIRPWSRFRSRSRTRSRSWSRRSFTYNFVRNFVPNFYYSKIIIRVIKWLIKRERGGAFVCHLPSRSPTMYNVAVATRSPWSPSKTLRSPNADRQSSWSATLWPFYSFSVVGMRSNTITKKNANTDHQRRGLKA